MKKYIGIDPGAHGGIAVLSADGSVVEVAKMPTTPMDLLDFLSKYKDDSFCVLERVTAICRWRCWPLVFPRAT